VKRGEEILKTTGAEDISSSSEAHADFAVSDKPMLRSRSTIVVEEPVVIVEKPVVVADDPAIHARTRTAAGDTRLDA
jgi:hypothetical protein